MSAPKATEGTAMLNEDEAGSLVGTTAYGHDGRKLGRVERVTHDDAGYPEFAFIRPADRLSDPLVVPVSTAALNDDSLIVAFDHERVAATADLGLEEADAVHAIRHHYGLGPSLSPGGSGSSTPLPHDGF